MLHSFYPQIPVESHTTCFADSPDEEKEKRWKELAQQTSRPKNSKGPSVQKINSKDQTPKRINIAVEHEKDWAHVKRNPVKHKCGNGQHHHHAGVSVSSTLLTKNEKGDGITGKKKNLKSRSVTHKKGSCNRTNNGNKKSCGSKSKTKKATTSSASPHIIAHRRFMFGLDEYDGDVTIGHPHPTKTNHHIGTKKQHLHEFRLSACQPQPLTLTSDTCAALASVSVPDCQCHRHPNPTHSNISHTHHRKTSTTRRHGSKSIVALPGNGNFAETETRTQEQDLEPEEPAKHHPAYSDFEWGHEFTVGQGRPPLNYGYGLY